MYLTPFPLFPSETKRKKALLHNKDWQVRNLARKKKVIVDVDTGIDDALSILYLLKQDVELLGITAVFGNVSAERAAENTLKILELAGAPKDISVFQGAEQPLFRPWQGPAVRFHGKNGLGNVGLPDSARSVQPGHAADFIVQKAEEYPEELTLLFLGPLTNLALALVKDVRLPEKVKEVVIMGGAIRVPGNVTPVSEGNIAGDPEAAHMVFSAGFPLTMVGLDVTMKAIFTERHLKLLEEKYRKDAGGQKIARVVKELLEFRFGAYAGYWEERGCPLHDPLAVAVALDPSLAEKVPMQVQIETKGTLSLGATVADLRIGRGAEPNVLVYVKADYERFFNRFIDALAK